MTSPTARVRLLARGAALAAFVLLASACSSTANTEQSTTASQSTTTVALTASTEAATTVAVTAAPVVSATVTIDPATALQQGLAALAAGYHFSSVVMVNGAQSLAADGDRIGAASRLVLAGDGGTVSYIITPDASYAQPEDGEWSLLDVPPATADPIAALQTPAAVTVLPTADGSVVVRVTVNAVSLGIAADGNVDVDVTLTGGAITQITYSATVDTGTAQVVTVVSAIVDTTPILAPI